jgi:peptidoglycan/xylan/chitin deacetylase (PgdA/CDA1 family)
MRLLHEYGIGYSSNFFDDDSPYLHELDGKPTDIVEFPFGWVLDDAPFFLYSVSLPGRTMHPPSSVLEAWVDEFDVLYEEDREFVIAMHPQIIGRPSRITLLEDLIRHITSHPGIWFARCDQVANAVRPQLKKAGTRRRGPA